jgi:hypothetical protein
MIFYLNLNHSKVSMHALANIAMDYRAKKDHKRGLSNLAEHPLWYWHKIP